jgi:hypothetical protein
MDAEHRGHEKTEHPDKQGQSVQSGGVSIELVEIDGGVSEHVNDDEEYHHLAGDGHEELSGDSGCWQHHETILNDNEPVYYKEMEEWEKSEQYYHEQRAFMD